jgi:hypothetical protein
MVNTLLQLPHFMNLEEKEGIREVLKFYIEKWYTGKHRQ